LLTFRIINSLGTALVYVLGYETDVPSHFVQEELGERLIKLTNAFLKGHTPSPGTMS
jgi:hypothetical protein